MGQYAFTGSAQFVTVATTGEYDIVAFGAQGGGSAGSGSFSAEAGGLGAEIGGDVELTAGEKLEIIVGGVGGAASTHPGGGGGGSFVLANVGGTYTPLIIAGGGGGSGGPAYKAVNGGGGLTSRGNGQGGYGGSGVAVGGAGGAGVKSNGQSGDGIGGFNRTGNYAGGTGPGTSGGFGGGGSGNSSYGGGGGGGYSGGFGGNGAHGGGYGGGGGSYDGGVPVANQTVVGENEDNGHVVIFPNVVCFASGTQIRTARGDVPVEGLVIGDLVVTASGATRPIQWLGSRTLDCRHHPRPADVMPVRIAAGTFGEGRPTRDLWMSPGHSVCLDILGEALIPAIALVDGTAIAQVEVDEVTYWHVELDCHDVILADGLPAESYLEMGNRTFFAAGDVVALHASPDARVVTHADFCRPFVSGGPLLEAVKARLKKRAGQLRGLAPRQGAAVA